jgi:hypothetical protein
MIHDQFPKSQLQNYFPLRRNVQITSVVQDLSQLREIYGADSPTEEERATILRLVKLAQGCTEQSGRVANFLLAWWDAGLCGGFDFANLSGIDQAVARDMVTVFWLVARCDKHPNQIDETLEIEFQAISKAWRPEA